MGTGDSSKMSLGEEANFGQTFDSNFLVKRLRILPGANMEIDPQLAASEEMTGRRFKGTDYKGILRGTGSFSILGTPEGGIGWIFKWLTGSVSTIIGWYRPRNLILTSVGGELSAPFVTTGVVKATDHSLFLRRATGAKQRLTASVSATPAALEYYFDETTKTVTFGTALTLGDQVILSWTEVVVGVYSHVYVDASSVRSFCLAMLRGDVRLFDYSGVVMNTLGMNINTSDILQLDNEVLFKDETHEVISNWKDLVSTKDASDPFLIKYAKVFIDQAQETNIQNFDLSYGNAQEPFDTINCSDTTNKFNLGTAELTVAMTQEFVDANTRDDFRALTLRDFEIVYGDCPAPEGGVEIGATGANYQLRIWIPAGQYTSDSVPIQEGVMLEDVNVKATTDIYLDQAFEFVLVNSVTGYPNAT